MHFAGNRTWSLRRARLRLLSVSVSDFKIDSLPVEVAVASQSHIYSHIHSHIRVPDMQHCVAMCVTTTLANWFAAT